MRERRQEQIPRIYCRSRIVYLFKVAPLHQVPVHLLRFDEVEKGRRTNIAVTSFVPSGAQNPPVAPNRLSSDREKDSPTLPPFRSAPGQSEI